MVGLMRKWQQITQDWNRQREDMSRGLLFNIAIGARSYLVAPLLVNPVVLVNMWSLGHCPVHGNGQFTNHCADWTFVIRVRREWKNLLAVVPTISQRFYRDYLRAFL
jgi:hypothetical protein